MALAFFYIDPTDTLSSTIVLSEETSRHIVQVLRMQKGAHLQLTDGIGHLFTAEIIDDNKKKCAVKIISTVFNERKENAVCIAISLLKNASRFEWFLEKSTEIGVTEIMPLVCARTEKQHFRYDRMKTILVSAMLQSQQTWLPVLHEPKKYMEFIKSLDTEIIAQRFIAHCEGDINKNQLMAIAPHRSSIILIGPEGDFTKQEIDDAIIHDFRPVALGETRLRTETAGITAAVLLCLKVC